MKHPRLSVSRSSPPEESIRVKSDDLERCESVIRRGLKSFVEVGRSLMTIRDKRLYRPAYSSFEAYCRNKWDLSRPYAYKLIAGSRVVDELSAEDEIAILPENANQVRKLSPLSKDERITAWKKVIEESKRIGEPITAALVQEVVAKTFRPVAVADVIPIQGQDPIRPIEKRAELVELWESLERAIAEGDLGQIEILVPRLRRATLSMFGESPAG